MLVTLFLDANGGVFGANGTMDQAGSPDGTAGVFRFDMQTNPGLAGVVVQAVEWPRLRVELGELLWNDVKMTINPPAPETVETTLIEKARAMVADGVLPEGPALLALLRDHERRLGIRHEAKDLEKVDPKAQLAAAPEVRPTDAQLAAAARGEPVTISAAQVAAARAKP